MDLTPYLTGNARKLGYGQPSWYENLAKFVAANPHGAKISSLDRDVAKQGELWKQALAKYGSPEAARKWVAPPGSSNHNKGSAADLKYTNDEARKWAHENAAAHGFAFPLSNENWHIEPAGARAAKTLPGDLAQAGAPEPGGIGPTGFSGMTATTPALPAPAETPEDASPWNGLAKGLMAGLGNMGGGAVAAQPAALPMSTGPVGLGGAQYGPLADQLAATAPALMPRSKTMADLLTSLAR